MADIQSPRLLYLKGALLLLIGVLASALILLQHPSIETALLLGVAVWAFARAYYFAFYVVEHYVDGNYKFASLWSFIRYVLRRRSVRKQDGSASDGPSSSFAGDVDDREQKQCNAQQLMHSAAPATGATAPGPAPPAGASPSRSLPGQS